MSDSCNPMDYSLPGSSVHGISQARVLEWVAISFSNKRAYLRWKTEQPSFKWDYLYLILRKVKDQGHSQRSVRPWQLKPSCLPTLISHSEASYTISNFHKPLGISLQAEILKVTSITFKKKRIGATPTRPCLLIGGPGWQLSLPYPRDQPVKDSQHLWIDHCFWI